MTLYTIHGHREDRVAKVMEEMLKLGAPAIRVVDCGDHYQAIEGTHRIEAARRLNLPVRMIVIDEDEMIEADSLDTGYFADGEKYPAHEIASELYSPACGCYEIDEDGYVELVFNGKCY